EVDIPYYVGGSNDQSGNDLDQQVVKGGEESEGEREGGEGEKRGERGREEAEKKKNRRVVARRQQEALGGFSNVYQAGA
ncbi:hypothetical protein ACC686_36840, partial [Rhizobium johnstonii]|uniref:hypothetical protein n=1 Tax=Rhizobium johnstonii TaxID=3019933 RepID=UPI003F95840F